MQEKIRQVVIETISLLSLTTKNTLFNTKDTIFMITGDKSIKA